MSPRVRIAPSPTGYFHVGTARTALYNWLVARQQEGVFVLRIEDTDVARGKEEWVSGILSALEWLGIGWDEGPYRQSENRASHVAAAEALYQAGAAYYCDCSREDVQARSADKGGSGYDGYCRDRGLAPGPGRALRFAVPREGETVVRDIVRGEVSFSHSDLDDFVVTRSDGSPLFLLSNMVDDRDMEITQVIRGEDHLSNTPRYQLLWKALSSAPLPTFAHLPMLVNEKRQKLSKRRDPVALEDYIKEGYLPDAMCNYLALLGWGPEDEDEILSREQLVEQFSLERVKHSPAFFDPVKLRHFNGVWMRRLGTEDFVKRSVPFLEEAELGDVPGPSGAFEAIAPAVRERVSTLSEVPAMVDFLFLEEPRWDERDWSKTASDPGAAEVLRGAEQAYTDLQWSAAQIEQATRDLGERLGLSLRKTQAPIRVAITGRSVGPPLFESLEVLGPKRTLARLQGARVRLGHP